METSTLPMPRTIGGIFDRAAILYGQRPAFVESAREVTFDELNQLRLRTARAFIMCGIEQGDCVAVWAPNMNRYVVATAGLQSVGAVFVPLNTRFKAGEAIDVLKRSRAKLLITVEEFLGTRYVDALAGADLPDLETIVLLRGSHAQALSWDEFIAGSQARVQPRDADLQLKRRLDAVTPDSFADMMFTSGTTGRSKAVRFTHEQTTATYEEWSRLMGNMHERDRYLIISPFFHTFGYKAGWLSCVMRGSCIYPVEVFDAQRAMEQIQRDRITLIPGPPTIFTTIFQHPDWRQYDLSSLRLTAMGATMIPAELVRRLSADLHIETIMTAYGLTETCGLVSITRIDDPLQRVSDTVGVPISTVDVRIRDADGNDVARGVTGEIVVRGTNVLHEYYEDPAGTASAFSSDGFFKTGDLGVITPDGYLCVTGRLKDMYIVGGFNCYPNEIENMLVNLAGVAQVAVIGVPDERLGEVGKAFIVKRAGATLSEADVIAWARDNMANYKVPRHVQFVDALPLNSSLKVMKNVLREMHEGSASGTRG